MPMLRAATSLRTAGRGSAVSSGRSRQCQAMRRACPRRRDRQRHYGGHVGLGTLRMQPLPDASSSAMQRSGYPVGYAASLIAGIATPTEAAVLGVIAVIVVGGFLYRELSVAPSPGRRFRPCARSGPSSLSLPPLPPVHAQHEQQGTGGERGHPSGKRIGCPVEGQHPTEGRSRRSASTRCISASSPCSIC